MIGTQPTGAINGVIIEDVSNEQLKVVVNGRLGKLAVLDDNGLVVAAGEEVAREARSVVLESHRMLWMAQGYLRVYSTPLTAVSGAPNRARVRHQAAAKTNRLESTRPPDLSSGIFMSAVSHEGLAVTIYGVPGRLAVIGEDGTIVAAGEVVAREVLAVVVNARRELMMSQGALRIVCPQSH